MAPQAEKKPAAMKAQKKLRVKTKLGDAKKKKKKKSVESYKLYIYKVLKQVGRRSNLSVLDLTSSNIIPIL